MRVSPRMYTPLTGFHPEEFDTLLWDVQRGLRVISRKCEVAQEAVYARCYCSCFAAVAAAFAGATIVARVHSPHDIYQLFSKESGRSVI